MATIKKIIITENNVKVVTVGVQGVAVNLAQFGANNLLGIKSLSGQNIIAEFNQAEQLALLGLTNAASDITNLQENIAGLQQGFSYDKIPANAGDSFFFNEF